MLGVNIDHIATVRNARNSSYPNLLRAVEIIKNAGAEIVTIHLREDRRHIRDEDVKLICQSNILPVNLEIAPTEEMLKIALQLKPQFVCIVPENRMELTTEGGLDIIKLKDSLKNFVLKLKTAGIKVSLFIEPNIKLIKTAKEIGADIVELHTGKFAEEENDAELLKIIQCSREGAKYGLEVHAGHGLTFSSALKLGAVEGLSIFHIGHFLVTEAIFIGLFEAVKKMKNCLK